MAITGFPPDLIFTVSRGGSAINFRTLTKLINNGGSGKTFLTTSSNAAEAAYYTNTPFLVDNTSYGTNNGSSVAGSYVGYAFQRVPGFFDVVCWTGDGSAGRNIPHNLTVTPELIIRKSRSYVAGWDVQGSVLGSYSLRVFLEQGIAPLDRGDYYGFSSASSTTLVTNTTGIQTYVNQSGQTQVAYLFATCPGVSKVGSYIGNGSSQTIACGFAAGARFVLIKRTDADGDWYVWDTARGIIAGNDPHLSLNTSAADVFTDDSIDPDNSGFIVNQVAATNINVTSATYIFLAIA